MLIITIPSKRIEAASYDFNQKMNWDDAKKACLELGKDWRLPNKTEIEHLYKEYFLNGEGNFKLGNYWLQESDDAAWSVDFIEKLEYSSYDLYMRTHALFNVRAVREI